MATNRLSSLLSLFINAKCDFIVVGGVSAVLNGAPIQTYDVDVVYAQTDENIVRLLAVLGNLNAVFRIQPERRLRPQASHLKGSGHLNLLTDKGPLDLLAFIGQNVAYEDLLVDATEMDIGDGRMAKILNLEKLIAFKEQLCGEKDIAVLPILRQTLKEKRRRL